MKESTNKFIQLHKLVRSLHENAEGLTLEDIQQQYGVSLRTAQRWIKEIQEVYTHMESFSLDGRKMYWRISERQIRKTLDLSVQDLSILNTSADLLKKNNLPEQAKQLLSLESKLKALVWSEKKRKNLENEAEVALKMEAFTFKPKPFFKLDENLLQSLHTALLNKQQIKINYYNKSSNKVRTNILEPYGILS